MYRDLRITPQVLKSAQELGHTPVNLSLLLLVPLVQVAWAEGSVQAAEQKAILRFAKSFNISSHSAYERLLSWFDERPSDEFFDRSTRDLEQLLDRIPADHADRLRQMLRFGCSEIANACGQIGFFRDGSNVNREERDQMLKIGERLGLRHRRA